MRVKTQARQSGDADAAVQHPCVKLGKCLDIDAQRRARADQVKITANDVPKLRHLVDACPPQEPVQRRHAPGLVAACHAIATRGGPHGAQLDKAEGMAGAVHPFGDVENRSPFDKQNQQDKQGERCRHRQCKHNGDGQVEGAAG